MIDPDTHNRLRAIEHMALVEGHNLFEDLDRARLLATEDRLRQAQVYALQAAVMQLEDQPTQALVNLGGGQNTAADAHKGTLEFLRFVIKQFEERR